MTEHERIQAQRHVSSVLSAAEFTALYAKAHGLRSLHDQRNQAEIDRLTTKFGPSIPPKSVDSGTAQELVAGPI
jgi:hypothetical protein